MNRKLILTISLFAIIPLLFCFGQDSTSYILQSDDIALKKKLGRETLRKKDHLLSSVEKEYSSDYEELYEGQFLEISSFWESSRPVTEGYAYNYLQSVVEKITKANPELYQIDARVVFSRDWWPNAYSLGDGTIVFNAGLFIFLENEAELAFILSHELAHYYLEHMQTAVKAYVEKINSKEFKKELRRLSRTKYGANSQIEEFARSIVFSGRKHSRDREAEADSKATEFILKTGYNPKAIKNCLHLLDSVDESSITGEALSLPEILQFENYPFKESWIKQESSIFSQLAEESSLTRAEKDSLKTHPDCSKRILLLEGIISQAKAGDKDFLVSEDMFRKLKKNFIYEIAEQTFRESNLSRNLYYNFLIHQKDPKDPFAVFSIVRCLNQLYKDQKNHEIGTKVEKENRLLPTDYNLLLRMLDRLRLDEIAALSREFCRVHLSALKKYPGFERELNKSKSLEN